MEVVLPTSSSSCTTKAILWDCIVELCPLWPSVRSSGSEMWLPTCSPLTSPRITKRFAICPSTCRLPSAQFSLGFGDWPSFHWIRGRRRSKCTARTDFNCSFRNLGPTANRHSIKAVWLRFCQQRVRIILGLWFTIIWNNISLSTATVMISQTQSSDLASLASFQH